MRTITIEGVLNGWIITVGCTTLVSEDKDKMLREIGRYIDDPKLVTEEYLDNAKNKTNAPGVIDQGCDEVRPERVFPG